MRRERRTGFTLIEMLMVVLIIAILVALVSGAVMRALALGPQATAQSEIRQFEVGLNLLKTDYPNAKFLPSRLVLREDNQYYVNPAASPLVVKPAYTATVSFLYAFFGKRINLAPTAQINWNGDTTISNTDLVLQGHECLVFFLGGIPNNNGGVLSCTGFSRNPQNPADPSANYPRTKPYYEFNPARLQQDTTTGFLYYLDPWGQGMPYLYFSSGPGGNNYNSTTVVANSDCPTGINCPNGTNNLVLPFQDSSTRFTNPNTFQILCAGKDGQFGPGGQWDPTAGVTDPYGKDDQSNFSRNLLGGPAN
jgi:general secretion pathway protein G